MNEFQLGRVPSYFEKPYIPVAKSIPDSDYLVESDGRDTDFPRVPLLKAGCYRIIYQPNKSLVHFHGTLRIDRSGISTTISGDLYRFKNKPDGIHHMLGKPSDLPFGRGYGIPIYKISDYYSYLKGTGLKVLRKPLSTISKVTITADEYVYSPPPAGAFSGSFGATPTRTVVMVLTPVSAPAGFTGPFFTGKLFVDRIEKGSVVLGWVSSYFRRATVEIDTLTGSVAPAAVPSPSGTTNEDFRTAYRTAGWDVKAIYDQTAILVPSGVNPNAVWSYANLHQVMLDNRSSATDLDKEWRAHLLIVPSTMGSGRGVMYDSIDIPREGAAAFSDDGYPTTESAWFGTSANQQARNVPRAFMRTALHEIGHVFNLIHQFFPGEGGSDNSIMTTTPEVADILQGPATGSPGIFPDNIDLSFNPHCRHDMIHFPDIVVRPGGIAFLGGSHAGSGIPEADFDALAGSLELRMELVSHRLLLGEPLRVKWTVTNKSNSSLKVPNDIHPKGQHAFLNVLNPQGQLRIAPSFVIATEHLHMIDLNPGASLKGETRLFWSTNGFAFEKPGRHVVNLEIIWDMGMETYGLKAADEVWVDYPITARNNDMAATLFNPEVGMYVALGGGAHFSGALDRFKRAMDMTTEAADDGPTALRGFDGILPKR